MESVKPYELEKLILKENSISNINVFEKVKFKKLKELELFHNCIRNIEVFDKIIKLYILESLEYLNLGYNGLDDDDNKNKFTSVKVLLKENLKEFKMKEDPNITFMSLE